MPIAFLFILLLFYPPAVRNDEQSHDLQVENVNLEDCKKCILMSDRSQQRIIAADLDKRSVIWEWKPEQSDIYKEHLKWFVNYSDIKPVYNNKYLLISSTAGGVALIRIADKKAVFYAYAGGNTHSIELLPDGNIVSASSTGNYLTLFSVNTKHFPDVYAQKVYLPFTHNVVWDKKRQMLWSAGKHTLYSLKYNFNCNQPALSVTDSINLPDINAHDLFPDSQTGLLWLTAQKGIYKFDPAARLFSAVKGAHVSNIKSISSGPKGFPTIIMEPKEQWWTDEIIDINGKSIFQLKGLKSYKARWFLPNTFSYLRAASYKVNGCAGND